MSHLRSVSVIFLHPLSNNRCSMFCKCLMALLLVHTCLGVSWIDNHRSWRLLPKRCGRRTPSPQVLGRIQYGVPATRGNHPWMVNLFYSEWDRASQHPLCSGSILNKKYVLTAAHCCVFNGVTPVIARVGEFEFDFRGDCSGNKCDKRIQDIEVESFKVHPEYKVSYKIGWARKDICLIRLKHNIRFNEYVEPICLPKSDLLTTNLVGETIEFAGWGKFRSSPVSPILRVTPVTVISSEECDWKLPKALRHDESSELCVQGRNQKICHGDSGGPLAYKGNLDGYTVIGIASYSTENFDIFCKDDSPVVFTDPIKYLNWTLDNLRP